MNGKDGKYALALIHEDGRRNLVPRDEELYADAFEYWCGDGNRNLRKTARHFDIPYETVRKWARSNRWMETFVESHGILVGPAVEAASSVVAEEFIDVVQNMASIAKDRDHAQSVAAARFLKDLLLRPESTAPVNQFLTLVDARTIHEVENMTPEQIEAYVRDEMQRNLDKAGEERTKKRS